MRMLAFVALGVLLVGLMAHAQPGSFDFSDGRRLMGWAPAHGKAAGEVPLQAFVDRPATGEPDITGFAGTEREDLQKLNIDGFGFSLVIPKTWRDGQKHSFIVLCQAESGQWAPLPGSPKEVFCEPLIALPEPLPEPERAPIPAEAQIWYGGEDTWAMPIAQVWASFAENRDQWTFVQQHAQAIALHNNNVAKGNLEQLQALKSVLDANHLALVAEAGGLEQWQAGQGDQFGEASARQELDWCRLWWSSPEDGGCGGKYDYVIMDDPLYRGLFPNDKDEGRSLDEVANELADAIFIWKQTFPGIKIVLGCNFPNWGWKESPAYFNFKTMKGPMGRGDYYLVLIRAVEVLRERGIELWGLILDNPFDYVEKFAWTNQRDLIEPIDLIARSLDVEATARSLGLKFGLYANTDIQDLEPEGVFTQAERDQLYSVHQRNYFEAYRAAGGEPDFWNTYSWMKSPSKLTPDTEPYTQSWNVSQLIKRLRGLPED